MLYFCDTHNVRLFFTLLKTLFSYQLILMKKSKIFTTIFKSNDSVLAFSQNFGNLERLKLTLLEEYPQAKQSNSRLSGL